MSLDKKLVSKTHQLNDFVHKSTEDYHHSRPLTKTRSALILPTQARHEFDIEYDLKDLLLIGALTRNSVLLTGSTDIGKTYLSKLFMNSLFGIEEVGWHRVDVDIDFGKETYTDTDFKVIKEGQKISDGLYTANGFLALPGIIWDEINRTHAKIGNKLLHAMDRDISLADGKRIKLGVKISEKDTYQFQIAAINEGEEYHGTFDMDKALRRRTVIEIPFDIFPLTPMDRLRLKRSNSGSELLNKENYIKTILEAYNALNNNLDLHPSAELFSLYIEAFDYCKNSLTCEKGSVASRNGSIHHICEKGLTLEGITGPSISCEFLKSFTNDLCPHVKGITPGISKNLISVARGFALLRAHKFAQMTSDLLHMDKNDLSNQQKIEKKLEYLLFNAADFENSLKQYTQTNFSGRDLSRAAIEKYCANLEIEIGDVQSALGFVGYSKLGLANTWINKYFQGNRYYGLQNFTTQAKAKFEEGLSRPEISETLGIVLSGNGSQAQITKIRNYCDSENPWLWRAISPYLESRAEKQRGEKINDIYGE
jgi:MoxR-like ATPase